MTKIGVIGCGWLGLPLALSFLEKKYEVLGTVASFKSLEILKSNNIPSLILNISDNQYYKELSDLDIVVIAIPPGKIRNSYSDSILNLCASFSDEVRVIFISTTSVYPDHLTNATEDYEFNNEDQLKENVLTEIKLQELLGKRLAIIRFAGLIGENRHPINTLSGKKGIKNGNSPVNLIHLNDCIVLINKVIEVEFWGEIVNGCYPIHPSKKEYYSQIARNREIPLPEFECNNLDSPKMVSSEKSETLLNFKYSTSII